MKLNSSRRLTCVGERELLKKHKMHYENLYFRFSAVHQVNAQSGAHMAQRSNWSMQSTYRRDDLRIAVDSFLSPFPPPLSDILSSSSMSSPAYWVQHLVMNMWTHVWNVGKPGTQWETGACIVPYTGFGHILFILIYVKLGKRFATKQSWKDLNDN